MTHESLTQLSKVFVRQPVLQILVGQLYSTKRFDYIYNTCNSVNIYSTSTCLGNMLSSFTLLIKIEHLSLFGMIDKDLFKKKQCLFPFFSFFIFRTYQMQWHWTYFGINNNCFTTLSDWLQNLKEDVLIVTSYVFLWKIIQSSTCVWNGFNECFFSWTAIRINW